MCPIKYEFYEYSGDVFEKDQQERFLEQENKDKDQNNDDQSDED